MIFKNLVTKKGKISKDSARSFAKILNPFAPHLAEELWHLYGGGSTLAYEEWPGVNQEYLQEDNFEYPVSVNGKLRFKLLMPVDAPEEEIKKAATKHEAAQKWISGKKIKNIIFVKNRIVNIVVG